MSGLDSPGIVPVLMLRSAMDVAQARMGDLLVGLAAAAPVAAPVAPPGRLDTYA